MTASYLQDKEFLEQLDLQEHREIFARVASLDIDGNPIEYIEGRITAGSINIDGTSTVRRTCNLTLVSQNLNINDFYWGIKTKIKLEIGLKNTVGDILKYNYIYEKDENGNTVYYYTNQNGSYRSHYVLGASGIYEIDKFYNTDRPNEFITLDEEQMQSIMPKIKVTNSYYAKNPYPDILWFPQGTFVISNFNSSIQTNGQTVTINGKDKMCMLNGDLGGQLTASIDFGQEEMLDYIYTEHVFTDLRDYISHTYYLPTNEYKEYKGNFNANQVYYVKDGENHYKKAAITNFASNMTYYVRCYELASGEFDSSKTYYDKEEMIVKTPIPIKKIIREAVHAWAGEPYQNIIINDLDDFGLEQLTYKGDKTLYCYRPIDDDVYRQLSTSSNTVVYIVPESLKTAADGNAAEAVASAFARNHNNWLSGTLADLDDQIHFDPAVGGIAERDTLSLTWVMRDGGRSSKPCVIRKLEYGEDAGYRSTELTYAGELICAIGDTVTSVLDKIKNMLGNFEYFYNLQGQFVFQKKQTYIDTAWTTVKKVEGDVIVTPSELTSSVMYNFEGNKLITAFQNTPDMANMRNDYSVWGVRKGISGIDLPVHMRYAIDKKPLIYTSYDGITYGTVAGFQIVEELGQEIQHTATFTYEKEPIPEWLAATSNLWWSVSDWAEYYKLLTGEYPAGALMQYGVEGFKGTIHFPGGEVHTCRNQLIFDYDTESGNSYTRNRWNPFQHGFRGCGHTYSMFLDWQTSRPGFKSYIYHPLIPSDIIGDYEEVILPDGTVIFNQESNNIVDWREIIYQMALDYFQYNERDDFLPTIAKNNPVFYPSGYTGYEQYYTDMQGFWRQLYNPDAEIKTSWTNGYYKTVKSNEDLITGTYEKATEWQDGKLIDVSCDYYLPGLEDSAEGTSLDDEIQGGGLAPEDGQVEDIRTELEKTIYSAEDVNLIEDKLDKIFIPKNSNAIYWNRSVFEAPESLNFWIDFLDDTSAISSFSVPSVGDRTKVVNDSKVTGIYFKEVPHFIFSSVAQVNRDAIQEKTGYSWIFLPGYMEKLFNISYRGKSAKDEIDSLIYKHSYCIENITITALPVYYLEPNTRIFVHDDDTGIDGEYIVTKITLPLTYNGTMQLTASKAPERII